MNYKTVKKSIDKRLEKGDERLSIFVSKEALKAMKFVKRKRPELKTKTSLIETLIIEEQRRLKE